MPPTVIRKVRPDDAKAVELIQELQSFLELTYPGIERYGWSPQQMVVEGVSFYLAWNDGEAVGCAGIKLEGTDHAEVKRLYVRPDQRKRGIGRHLMARLEDRARELGARSVRLETGNRQLAAIKFYESIGYKRCPLFGKYQDDGISLFYEKNLY
jgi:putative acetyltransferase